MFNALENYKRLQSSLPLDVVLVAVSKTKPVEDIELLYKAGQRDFGENRVQELTEKASLLPKDIRWHLIGHLQKNKVKYIVPFIHLIHSVDSLDLLTVIDKEAGKINRVVDILLQIHIAEEDTKYGLNESELNEIIIQFNEGKFQHVHICGLMGMATFTENQSQIIKEFETLKGYFEQSKSVISSPSFTVLSMGMSGDFALAIETGSNMIRVGSALFGSRS
jgi:pyridoxal phosphate enzyme (YggS family)